jgi:hypothetical protein
MQWIPNIGLINNKKIHLIIVPAVIGSNKHFV